MDRKSIEAVARVQELREMGDDSNLYSEAVRSRAGEIAELSDEEVEKLYRDSFAEAKHIAGRLTKHPLYDAERGGLDLTAYGLGFIGLLVVEDEGEEASSIKPHTRIELDPSRFQEAEYDADPPTIWLNNDGTVEPFRFADVRAETKEVLDFLETLETIQEVLPQQ